jgi:hypothetical protein
VPESVGHQLRQSRAALVLYTRLVAYLRSELRPLVLTIAAMVATTLLTLGRPWPMQVIVDSVLGSQPPPWWLTRPLGPLTVKELLVAATGLMLVALGLGIVLSVAQQYFSRLLGQRIVCRLRCDLDPRLPAEQPVGPADVGLADRGAGVPSTERRGIWSRKGSAGSSTGTGRGGRCPSDRVPPPRDSARSGSSAAGCYTRFPGAPRRPILGYQSTRWQDQILR